MVHFHSGDPKMVVENFESNNTILDLYTGVKRKAPKKELERFFDLKLLILQVLLVALK